MADGFAWESMTRLIVQIASWISTVWVAALLTPDDYGLVGVAGIFTGFLLRIAGLGLGSAIVNSPLNSFRTQSACFWLIFGVSGLCYLLLYSCSGWIETYFEMSDLARVIQVSGLMLFFSGLSAVPQALLMRAMSYKTVALIGMCSNFIVIGATLALAFLGFGYWSLILSTLAAEVFMTICFFATTRFSPLLVFDVSQISSQLRYGLQIAAANIVRFINTQWPVGIIGTYLGQAATGSFQMAHMLAALPLVKIGEIFEKITFPAVSSIQNDREEVRRLFLVMHRNLVIITVPMFLGLAFIAEDLVMLVLGDKWVSIISPMQILCILNVLRVSAQLMPRFLDGVGDPKANVFYQAALFVIVPTSLLVGITWGLEGMLWSWTICYPIAYLFLIARLKAKIAVRVSVIFDSIFPAVLSACVMCLVLFVFDENVVFAPFYQLITKILIGCSVYFLTYYLLRRQDLKDLIDLFRKAKILEEH
ncbi:hypothetical protein A3765_16365 [Oleiphilus sp. HI0130]|nr:hypothetical protein A3765_16365 [Oleiphilus sp. HI0130]